MKTSQKKRIGYLFLTLFVLLTASVGQASAMVEPAIHMVPLHQFQPVVEAGVDKDGKLTGIAIVEANQADNVFLSFEGSGKTEQLQLLLSNDRAEFVTSVKTRKETLLTAPSTTIDVKEIRFAIPVRQLPVSSGEYKLRVWQGVKGSDLTYGRPSNTISIEIPRIWIDDFYFPGEVSVTNEGTIRITIKNTTGYEKAAFYFVVLDSRGREVRRIAFSPKNPGISRSDLDLPAGEYTIFLELVDSGERVRSNYATYVIPAQTHMYPIPNGKYFPGEVSIGEDGTIQLTLRITSTYEGARFYLLILNEDEEVVKRISINSRSSRLSTNGYNLPPGKYTVMIEMLHQGEKYYSETVRWVIPELIAGIFPIPSGPHFPGGVKVNSNGTITITLDWKSTYSSYTVYLLVYDYYGNVVKRIPIDLKKRTISIRDLQVLTGGYSIVIEIADPRSGLSAHSVPTFVTVNTSNQIIIFIDGQLQTFQKPPVEVNGRTLVPLRAIFEALGAKVEWDEATQTVTATKDGNTIKLTIGSKVAYKNGEKIFLDVPAQLFNGDTTMVPIRFVSEALGAKVGWDAYSNSVIITNQ